MARLIDSYMSDRVKVGHIFCIAKSVSKFNFLTRIGDVIGVITGRYEAVKFVRTELQKDKKFAKEFDAISPKEVEEIKGAALDTILQMHGRMNKFGDLKIKRNDLCFCGSGKKFKQCHGNV